jgi:hypothetical protein
MMMMRHDYCSECKEMVNYWDVICTECSASQCFGCITPYNYQSALYALGARFQVMNSPYILVNELEPYLVHIHRMVNDGNTLLAGNHTISGTQTVLSERGHEFFVKKYDTNKATLLLLAIEKMVEQNKDTPQNIKIRDHSFVKLFIECFNSMDDCGIYTYKCHKCHTTTKDDIRYMLTPNNM